jgi:hypothetical protein
MSTLLDQDDGVFTPAGTGNRYRVSASLNAAIDDFETTGLYDSSTNGVGKAFAAIVTVATWRSADQADVAAGNITATEASRRDLQYCLGLAEAIRPEWIALDREHVENIFDQSDNTEVLRRIPGFLSIIDSMLKPLLGQAGRALQVEQLGDAETPPTIWYEEDDPVPREARHFLSLVTSHMHCYDAYYRRQYLAHLDASTKGSALVEYATTLLGPTGIVPFLDFGASYLAADRWVVPFVIRSDDERPQVLADIATALGIDIDQTALDDLENIEALRHDSAVVPMEGSYLEAVAGNCVLKGVGDHASVDLDLSITGSGSHGKGNPGPGAGGQPGNGGQ